MIEGFESALVVAAHPDDEILGCGGTVARLARAGCRVNVLILATGAASRAGATNADQEALADCARRAGAVLGVSEVRFCGFPDNAMDSLALLDIVKSVERAAESFRPDLVLTHHGGDLNVDHRLTHQAVVTAFRPLPGAHVRLVLAFETVSATEWSSAAERAFRPQFYVSIERELALKEDALACYAGELRPFPHPRSQEHVRNLARVRGAEMGSTAAEAFSIVRAFAR
jgi:LmbE family N-acetylglucosaminyl deacetylase